MKTKVDFLWYRSYSVVPGGIAIPAGSPVEYHRRDAYRDNTFWINPSLFKDDSILKHDAIYHGCRVAPDNVVSEPGECLPGKTHSYAWSGKMPCTGLYSCVYCGKEKQDV